MFPFRRASCSSSCATVAVSKILVPEYAVNDDLQKVRLLVGFVELEGPAGRSSRPACPQRAPA